jgi:hypothetical protein
VGALLGDADPNPEDRELYNSNNVAQAALMATTGMQRAGLSEAAMAELRLWMKNHGSLPDELRQLAPAEAI